MKILYISSLASERLINKLFNYSKQNPGFAVQKFNRLLVKGFLKNGEDIVALTNPPITFKGKYKYFTYLCNEVEDGVRYKYIPFINIPLLKHICIFLYSFFYVLFWGMAYNKNKAIVCDALSISSCLGSLLASKIIHIRSVGIITDMPNLMINTNDGQKKSFFLSYQIKINMSYISSFSHYVFLTEEMNSHINKNCHPYIIMEGLVEGEVLNEDNVEKANPRTILYAGGIHEKYGLKMLVEAFHLLLDNDIRLVIYGSGSYVNDIKEVSKVDPRIEYRGLASNSEILKSEYSATLLVNPRFTTEEFTKYSFPSKNMEYMVSGTPLLTTKLPGMPIEYYSYVYLIEEETVAGYAKAIKMAISHSQSELNEFGAKAKDFVIKNKNNTFQVQRIIQMMKL